MIATIRIDDGRRPGEAAGRDRPRHARPRRPSGSRSERSPRRSSSGTPSSPSRTSPTRADRGVRGRAVPAACACDQRSGAPAQSLPAAPAPRRRSTSHTTCSCGSHAGRLCQPPPPGKRGGPDHGLRRRQPRLGARLERRAPGDAVRRDADVGRAPAAARRRCPGRLLRDGATPSGSTNAAVRPGACGVIVIVSSVPPATGLSVKALTVAGGGPGRRRGRAEHVRRTEAGRAGCCVFGTSVARYQPPGALGVEIEAGLLRADLERRRRRARLGEAREGRGAAAGRRCRPAPRRRNRP